MSSTRNTYPRGTREYLKATVTADVELDDQDVAIAVGDLSPDTAAWLPAEWDGDPWTTLDRDGQTLHNRRCRTVDPVAFIASNYAAGQYVVGVKVTDTPEIPVMTAGQITLT